MKNIQMRSDWLRVALLLSEISCFATFYWLARCRERLFTIIMSLKSKRSVFSMKDKESIIGRLEKGEKGTNLLAECGVSKQQISDIRKNKETSMKFADILRDQRRTEAKIAESCT